MCNLNMFLSNGEGFSSVTFVGTCEEITELESTLNVIGDDYSVNLDGAYIIAGIEYEAGLTIVISAEEF